MIGNFDLQFFDEDYTYFLGLYDEARQKKFIKLAYHTRWESVVMGFCFPGRREAFLHYNIRQEKEKLKAVMKTFKYLDTLVEKVKLIALEVFEKNEALAFVQASLSKVEFALAEEEQS
ncbi:unnamed protein product [Vicia faba]|uniref:Uncharacterized protein n=1 Tax=Vicia faba TaxID=3906 RepID=A0AAV1A4K8_VICFA|nr:unnamed protein product [Vicia faba]